MVLGRPGSGCTTLLKTLANLREEYHAVEGNIYYDSILPEDLKKHLRGDVQYCPEEDIHFPSLTVDQTLTFAAKTRAPRVRLDYSRKEYTKFITDILTGVFGLSHTRKTPVGDAIIRGISGGEKKRVSIAETLTTRSCITAWDKSVVSRQLVSYITFSESHFSQAQQEVSMLAQPSNSFTLCASVLTYSD